MRWVVGLILVFAATLKGAQLFIDPVTALATGDSHWLAPVHVGVEFGVGLLILSGLYWQQLRWLVLLLFTLLAAYSLHLALSGAASCDCFGPVKVHPWWTFLIDVAVVLGLVAAMRRQATASMPTQHLTNFFPQPVFTLAMVVITAVGVALLARHGASRTASADGLLTMAGDLVILEPELWVGKPLPIADSIDIDLTQGQWIVLLHRHDCPDCQKAMPRYEQLALQEPVVLVEVPPFPEQADFESGAARRARLSNDREWFVQTPVELQLQDGVVLAVKNGHGH